MSGIGFLLGGAGLLMTLTEGGRKVTEWAGAFNLRDKRISYPFAGMALNAVALFLTAVIAISGGFSNRKAEIGSKVLQKMSEIENSKPAESSK
jgi:hypothetical protein